MQTLQPTQTPHATPRHGRPKAIVALAVAIVVVVGAAIAIWAITNDDGASDDGPVAAEDARIELTFTGDDASYVGDREVTEGRAEVVFINEGTRFTWFIVQYFEPGSAQLETELDRGTDFVTDVDLPPGETPIFTQFGPGRTTRSILLEPGTYLIQSAESGEDTTHVWQPGVVEVVSD